MKRHKGEQGCTELEPDCFNCPFPDCIASQHTIVMQLSFEKKKDLDKRDLDIYKLSQEGIESKDLAARYSMTVANVNKILRDMRTKERSLA